MRASWGGPGCARPLGVPPSFPQQTAFPPTPPLRKTVFLPPFNPVVARPGYPPPPQTSGLSRYCRCAARQAHLLCGFFSFFSFFLVGATLRCLERHQAARDRSPPGLCTHVHGVALPCAHVLFSFLDVRPSPSFLGHPPFFIFVLYASWPGLNARAPRSSERVRSLGPRTGVVSSNTFCSASMPGFPSGAPTRPKVPT